MGFGKTDENIRAAMKIDKERTTAATANSLIRHLMYFGKRPHSYVIIIIIHHYFSTFGSIDTEGEKQRLTSR